MKIKYGRQIKEPHLKENKEIGPETIQEKILARDKQRTNRYRVIDSKNNQVNKVESDTVQSEGRTKRTKTLIIIYPTLTLT